MDNRGRYSRNRIYVGGEEQDKIRNTRILLGGAGIGSVIAECALRFGFENITVVDGDKVEESNLNRQNYVTTDTGKYKAESLCARLAAINPAAGLKCVNTFIDGRNAAEIVSGHDIAVNALDFKDGTPFEFDRICSEKGIPVLHPYNFGWAGFLAIVKPGGRRLSDISDNPAGHELKVAEYAAGHGNNRNAPVAWLERIVEDYRAEKDTLPPPQLSVASWIVAGYCVGAMFNLAVGKEVKYFPEFYFSSFLCDETD